MGVILMAHNETYEEFVEKFKQKKTTDDCYTPPKIYEIIKSFVISEYKLQDKKVVRPFYPGGDYENFKYTKNCVVIDNPPFSILSEILKYYIANNVKFFLFAPALTCFSSNNQSLTYIVTNTSIIYENGAIIKTSFITNMDKYRIRTWSKLSHKINKTQKRTQNKKQLPKYKYPDNLITVSRLHKLIDKSIDICISNEECSFIRQLDSQKELKKSIFGSGFLISDKKKKELLEKETIIEGIGNIQAKVYTFKLSEREQQIVDGLK